MHSACNTLPSPNDPALNAPTITAFDPTTALNSETQSVPELKNPAAIHLASHGLWAKAIDRENCSKFCLLERCDGSVSPAGHTHVHPIYITCRQRYCKYCGQRRQRESLERWYAGHPYLRKRNNFLYFEISRDFDGIPFPQLVEYFNDDVLEFADIAQQGRIAGTGGIWNTVIRHIEGDRHRLVAKFIWWGDWDKDEAYELTWWGSMTKVTMQVIPPCSFDAALKQVFDQEIPDDPIKSAHYEMAIQDVRTTHAAGGFVRAKEGTPADPKQLPGIDDISEELFPTTELLGNNSIKNVVNSHSTSPKTSRGCQTCGAPIVQRSEKVSVDISPSDFDKLKWFDTQPPG